MEVGPLKRVLGVFFAATMIALFCLCGFAAAHPPKEVALSWNPSGTLTVKVTHNVNDPLKHYIYRIVIYVNDEIKTQKDISTQQSPEGQTETFSLGGLPSGAKVKAEAFCVIMGSASGSITIP